MTRAAGRRRLRRLLWVLGLVAAGAAAAGAVLSPLLDVNRIAVSGVEGAHAEEVRSAVAVPRGDALLLVDTGAAAARVESLSWVEEATVARQLPGTLAVEVTPRFPVAWRATADGRAQVLDRRGDTVMRGPVPPAGLPQVTAPRGGVRDAARVAGALTSTLRPLVSAVSVDAGRARLVLADGYEVRLGPPRGLPAKVRAIEAMLAILGGARGSYLDVSSAGTPVTG